MSWQLDEEEEANRANEEENNPADWHEKEDSDAWRNNDEESIPLADDKKTKRTDNLDDNNTNSKEKQLRPRAISKHYNLQSTETLLITDGKWIFFKSILLWIYLVIMSTGALNYNTKSPQLIWFISYIILLIFWCLFFRLTASSSRGGFYPLLGDWTQQLYHTTLFIFGLGGIDMYYLEKKKVIMRECIMQYKIVEFSILWFCYFISLSFSEYPWSTYIEEEYINWSTNFSYKLWFEHINTIPILILLMDSIVHYSYVYHYQFWQQNITNNINYYVNKLKYIYILFILWIDSLIRGLILILFVKVSLGYI
eukprot:544183_1